MYVAPPGKGRRPAPLDYLVTRELGAEDVVKLWELPAERVTPLKKLRYNHHLLAKAVASGKSLMECSAITGLTGARISVIKNDPAFMELVSFYAEELHEVFVDVHARMASLGTSVLEELQERFEDAPDKFSKKELMELFTTMADRSIPTAKGGPKAQQASLGLGPNGGLALQINFVGSDVTEHIPLTDGQTAKQVLAEREARQALLPAIPVEGGAEFTQSNSPVPDLGEQLAFDLDGEPSTPRVPRPIPTPQEFQEARLAATAQREREAAERDAERERLRNEI